MELTAWHFVDAGMEVSAKLRNIAVYLAGSSTRIMCVSEAINRK